MTPLDAKRRRELAADANRLKAHIAISSAAPSDSVIEHIRNSFADRELVKIRMNVAGRDDCEAAAATIAEKTPCQVVQRVGRVLTLYRKKSEKLEVPD